MQEQDVISKLQQLRNIKPSQNWVVLTKSRILATQNKTLKDHVSEILSIFPAFTLQYKYAFASFMVLAGIFVSVFSFARGALPGDFLYPVKKITEKAQKALASERDKSALDLGVANKRLEDLNKIAQEKKVKNINPAVNEFQASISQAAKSLVKKERRQSPSEVKKIAAEIKKLAENQKKIESLGIVVGSTQELNNALKELVQEEIEDLEKGALTPEKRDILKQAKEYFDQGLYSEALEKVLECSQI